MQTQRPHNAYIIGTGSYLPGNPIPFDDLDQVLGPLDQVDAPFKRWYERTRRTMKQLLGMEYYFHAIDPETGELTETPSTLASKAAVKALEHAGVAGEEVDLIIYAGASQDAFGCPPTSTFIQQHLGIERCAELSIHSNCTSTYKAIQIAADQLALGRYRTVLIATANQVSGVFRASELNQQALTRHQAMVRWFLCDGGGALVMTADTRGRPALRVVDTYLESVGTHSDPQMFTRYGSATPMKAGYEQGAHHLTQNFQEVSAVAPGLFLDGFDRFMKQLGLDPGSESYIQSLSHFMANVPSDHLVEGALEDYSKRYRVPLEHLKRTYYSTVQKRGYTGPAAIAISLDELMRGGTLDDGKFLASFVVESSKWMNAGFYLQYQA